MGRFLAILILLSATSIHRGFGQQHFDVHLDSVGEIMGTSGMTSLAGLVTDRGGIAQNREKLALYLSCEGMLLRSLWAHHNTPFLAFFIDKILTYVSVADAYNELALPDSALLYSSRAEEVISNKAFIQLFATELRADAEYGKRSEKEIETKIADESRGYITLIYEQEVIAYHRLRRAKAEIDICRKYLDLEEDVDARFKILQHMGEAFRMLQKEDSALIYFRRALDLSGVSSIRCAYLFHLMGDSYLYDHVQSLDRCLQLYDSARIFITPLYRGLAPFGGGGIKSPYPEHEQANNEVGEMDWDPASTFHEDLDDIFAGGTKAWLRKANESNSQNAYIDSAFAFCESGRALGLRRLMKVIEIQSKARYGMGALVNMREVQEMYRDKENEDTISWGTRMQQISYPLLTYRLMGNELIIFLRTSGGELHYCRRKISNDSLFRLVSQFRNNLGVGYEIRGLYRASIRAVERTKIDPDQALGDLLFPTELSAYLPTKGELVIIPHSFLSLLPPKWRND